MGKPSSSIQYRRMVAVPLITHNSKINVDTATFCIYVFRQDLKG